MALGCASETDAETSSPSTTETSALDEELSAAVECPAGDGGAPTACVKGEIKASEVVFIGESFIAQTGAIPRLMAQHARDAGAIGRTESYRSFAVSGTQLANGQISSQYARAKAQSPVKVVLMDGGGNDLLFGGQCKNGPNSCSKIITTLEALFAQMGADGVKEVVYFFYPDPQGIGASIKPAMDILRPQVQDLCASTTDVRCTWVDQRASWEGNYAKFTSDGIHPTEAGAAASAKQIWGAMTSRCIAQ